MRKKTSKTTGPWVAFLLIILMVFSVSIHAEETAVPEEEQIVLSAVQVQMEQKISVDFSETPIDDVIRMLAKQADVDIVKSPLVIGDVTATLTDIPLSEALDNILAAHGYGYIATENMIRVVPRSELTSIIEKIVTRIYRITYADVNAVETALTKFISAKGSISSNQGTSNIIVSDTESKIEAIDEFIEEIDRITQQVLVEVRIYDVTDSEDFDLDIEWNAYRNIETGDGLLYGPDTGSSLNSPPMPTDSSGSPVDLVGPTKRTDPFAAGSWDKSNGGAVRLGFLNDSLTVDVLLTMLHKQGNAKLLANPSIMVLDNETATFEIIQEIPYKEETSTGMGGQLTSTEFKDVGVKLEVIPHITRDNMLRLHIMPEFGVAEEQLTNPITNEPIVPTVNTRKLDTVALLRNGQTVVLGGMKKREVVKNLWKTPLLGDLPFIKNLFRSESETVKNSELLVFITPRILDEASMLPREIEVYELTEIRNAKDAVLKHVDKQPDKFVSDE